MTYIKPNILLTPTEKLIKPYECSFIVIEGPNLKGKIDLQGLEIGYNSFYVSQLTLNPNSKDQPLIYGFLGDDVTFLLVRAKYLPLDPNWAIETEQYINYYFGDEPGQIRSMGQLLVLTGNSTNRIPQIYFNNPSSIYQVYLEVLMANLPQSDLTNTNQYTQKGAFSNLYWNSLISDVIYYSTPTSTGSTELKVIDVNGDSLIAIPYNNIRTIIKDSTTTLSLGLDTEEKVKIEFLTEYYCDQANSRINWVLKSQRNRILTKNYPSEDSEPPVISWNDVLSGITTGITEDVTTDIYLLPSGETYFAIDIQDIFISGITDNRDGEIDKYNSTVEMFYLNDLVPVDSISDIGIYRVIISVKDLANNTFHRTIYISIYEVI